MKAQNVCMNVVSNPTFKNCEFFSSSLDITLEKSAINYGVKKKVENFKKVSIFNEVCQKIQ